MLDVQISQATVGSLENHEFIKPSSWLRFIGESQHLQLLLGDGIRTMNDIAPTLVNFWQLFRVQFPNHEIFQKADAGKLRLSSTLPLYMHGDEGRTLKKKPLFILQFSLVFGRGSGKHNTKEMIDALVKQHTMLVNAKGNTLRTRFLMGLMHRKDYSDDPDNLDSLVELICQDFQMLGDMGIEMQGQRVWAVVIAAKGDWEFLVKLGHLSRSYRNAPKHNSGQDRGMCHLCLAGEPGFPFEDVCHGLDTVTC